MTPGLVITIAACLLLAYSIGFYIGYKADEGKIRSYPVPDDLKSAIKSVTIRPNKVEFANPVTPEQAFKDSKTLDEFIKKTK